MKYAQLVKGTSKELNLLVLFIFISDDSEGILLTPEGFRAILQANSEVDLIEFRNEFPEYSGEILKLANEARRLGKLVSASTENPKVDLEPSDWNFIRFKGKIFECVMTRELDSKGDPVYGLVRLDQKDNK